MSNFFKCKIVNDEGREFSSSESIYQSAKFAEHPELYDKVSDPNITPSECYKLAWANKDKFRADWENVKDDVMENALRLKFGYSPELMKKLIDTYPKEIIEHSLIENILYVYLQYDRNKYAGKLLMKIRDQQIAKL